MLFSPLAPAAWSLSPRGWGGATLTGPRVAPPTGKAAFRTGGGGEVLQVCGPDLPTEGRAVARSEKII